MFRRNFLQLAALSGAGLVASLERMKAGESKTVVYHVQGFSCPTCAVGLDTILQQQKGVRSSQSTYPEGKVTVAFNPDRIAEDTIRGLIAEMGFTVQSEHTA